MTQQPMQPLQIQLRAVDIGNAIIQQEMVFQTTYSYLAAVIKQMGGTVVVAKEIFEGLKNTESWEVAAQVGEDNLTLEVIEGKAMINKKLGRTPAGIITP